LSARRRQCGECGVEGDRARAVVRGARANARGFTLIEAMLASALLGVVGAAVAALLSAFAGGTSARARVSDPALEATLAARRLAVLAPAARATLATDGALAAIWIDDHVPSRTVHLSELGWVRHDPAAGELLFDAFDRTRTDADPFLEEAFTGGEDFLALHAWAAGEGLVTTQILAEGVDRATLARDPTTGALVATLESDGVRNDVRLLAGAAEEPIR
jgi:type II secretory pathway pseudopilin PulG